MAEKKSTKTIAENRKARHEYFILDSFETGIELFGTEVKSIRAGSVNLKESWCEIENGELLLKGMHVSPYEKGNIFNKDPLRERK
ncbi:MAG: SsrA-binding protein, partial [Ruthenibacterium sp.]